MRGLHTWSKLDNMERDLGTLAEASDMQSQIDELALAVERLAKVVKTLLEQK